MGIFTKGNIQAGAGVAVGLFLYFAILKPQIDKVI